MHLSVNLSPPPPEGSAGSCSNAPKTPEILSSIISLSTPSNSSSMCKEATHQRYDVDIPVSSMNSTEIPANTSLTLCSEAQDINNSEFPLISRTSNSPFGSSTDLSRRGMSLKYLQSPGDSTLSSPSELPSPISTFEATKSALIKEGLKHQIKSKLRATGVRSLSILNEPKKVKEELTPDDEEKRMKRRERNKVAATKCRNKKKEKTNILLNESETFKNQNFHLKNEIQRLTDEKLRLTKLLQSSDHLTSCKFTSSKKCIKEKSENSPVLTHGEEQSCLKMTKDTKEWVCCGSSEGNRSTFSPVTSSRSDIGGIISNLSPRTSPLPFTSYAILNSSTFSPLSLSSVSPSSAGTSVSEMYHGNITTALPSFVDSYAITDSKKSEYTIQTLDGPSLISQTPPKFFQDPNCTIQSESDSQVISSLLSPESPNYFPFCEEDSTKTLAYESHCSFNYNCIPNNKGIYDRRRNDNDEFSPQIFTLHENELSSHHCNSKEENSSESIKHDSYFSDLRYSQYVPNMPPPISNYSVNEQNVNPIVKESEFDVNSKSLPEATRAGMSSSSTFVLNASHRSIYTSI